MNSSNQPTLTIPEHIYAAAVATQGIFGEQLCGIDRNKLADDLLSEAKAHQQAAVLEHFANLRGARVLEVGAGLGSNLVIWSKCYGADVYGIEPDGVGFDASYKLACTMMEANGLDPNRIINAPGEHLPFPDGSFDIVFSANVLEHTDQPAQVLMEAVRVLRPGGVLQFVYPNHTSYYDGHYGVLHPPILWRGFFPWYVKWVWRRDPAFARTLRTELNASWTRRQVRALQSNKMNVELLGLGTDLFLERMTSLDFNTWASLGRVKRLLDLIGNAKVRRLLGRVVIALNGWTPIVLTLRKSA
jgi:ubiquinone/menaquinone biosynthesis C-methylase UbiE